LASPWRWRLKAGRLTSQGIFLEGWGLRGGFLFSETPPQTIGIYSVFESFNT
jgi:hypothetical protein